MDGRIPALVAVTALAALTAGGCGSSAKHDDSSSGGSTPTATTTSAGGSAEAQIKQAYVQFFSGKTGAATKISLVQNGAAFAKVIHAQAGGALSQSTTASVSSVMVDSPTSASVIYTVSLGGTPALKSQGGQAVKEDGHWKVSATTFCKLLTLEGSAPAICTAS